MSHFSLQYAPALAAALIAAACGGSPPRDDRIHAEYDKNGRLRQLTLDSKKDGKPDTFSYMDGTKFVRIEIDQDEDGRIDRWEYYGSDQKVEKVGFSRANNGQPDAWAFPNPDGSIKRIEVSTRRDGRRNRTEFYERGEIARAEEDTNADGRIDKWETYAAGALTSVAFDTKHKGIADTVIDYRKETSKPEKIR